MTRESAAHQYRQTSLESAPPLKIVRLLYAGCLRFLKQAEQAGKGPEFVKRLQRADAIVCELRGSLDHEKGGDVAAQLEQLYLFVERQINEAIVSADAQPIAAASQVLSTLLDGWNRIDVSGARAEAA